MAALVLADLEARIGAQRCAQLFDFDGDGVADETAVAAARVDGMTYVTTALLIGFTTAQIAVLAEDDTIKRALADVVLGIAAEAKPEWLNAQGKGLYDGRFVRGKEQLRAIAKAENRVAAEATAGANALVGGQVTQPDPNLQFASTRARPMGMGGY